MTYSDNKRIWVILFSLVCVSLFTAGRLFGASTAAKALKACDGNSSLVVVIGCGDKFAPETAVSLGENGDSLVHAIAGNAKELAAFNEAIAQKKVKGCVSAEELGIETLPYRDYMVNAMVIMDFDKAQAAGLKMEEAQRCMAPEGKLVICKKGKVNEIETIPMPDTMDSWTHRYYGANGIPASSDKVLALPVGFKWNAGLPMNFDNPKRSANRYSSTRAMVATDGRVLTFSTAVYENLGDGWKSEYGTDQYLTCRDAFNGRLLWRKRIGNTYYGGLYIENLAPVAAVGQHIYMAGENGKMLKISTRTGKTELELPTTYIPGVIAAANGIVVAATWKGGESMGSVARYDRRRMDWDVGEGTIEAFDEKSGKQLWKHDLLGTSMLIDDGRVFIVNRSGADEIEKNHGRKAKDQETKRPPQKVAAFDLARGKILWETASEDFKVTNQSLNLEAAGHGAVVVTDQGRRAQILLSASDGKLMDDEATKELKAKFVPFRGHICTPVFRTDNVILQNRGGFLKQGNVNMNFGGARAACLTGTVPAYGAGFIAQNWCKCSPGQIPGLLAIAPIGTVPESAEMEAATTPITRSQFKGKANAAAWTSFRGNSKRNSSAPIDVPAAVNTAWSTRVTGEKREGTVQRDWRSYLNSRLTAAVMTDKLAIVGDIDHNEIIAVNLKDGTVAWRFMTGGRMDTSPTLYNGICLVGDHTGYVYAINTGNGELVYKLRIAPEEKRMLSYGKIESVWPVIGGVMVANGKAYASAGRSSGSDGGLLVRAFVPETGKQIWARALPGQGKASRRNDALIQDGDFVKIMSCRLELDTGKICQAAPAPGKKNKDKKIQVPSTITSGLEGLYSWNWTRVGHRKFGELCFGSAKGDTVSWSGNYAAACDRNNNLSIHYVGEPAKDGAEKPKLPQKYTVSKDRQVTSLVVCNNVVILGGGIMDKEGDKGFVQAISLKDASSAWDKTFAVKLSFNGLAVDKEQIIATFNDGTVTCLK